MDNKAAYVHLRRDWQNAHADDGYTIRREKPTRRFRADTPSGKLKVLGSGDMVLEVLDVQDARVEIHFAEVSWEEMRALKGTRGRVEVPK
jgi:hypothetical protein